MTEEARPPTDALNRARPNWARLLKLWFYEAPPLCIVVFGAFAYFLSPVAAGLCWGYALCFGMLMFGVWQRREWSPRDD